MFNVARQSISSHRNMGERLPHLLFWPDKKMLSTAGFDSVAEVPVVFSDGWIYHRAASWYLRDRANCRAFVDHQRSRTYPGRNSLEAYGRALIDFLDWTEASNRNWQTVDYKRDLLDSYQANMLTGDWSVMNSPLSPSTINRRVDEASFFLKWAERVKLRGSFNIPIYKRILPRAHLGNKNALHGSEGRLGRVRPAPIELRIPSDEEVTRWLQRVRIQSGATLHLMCELILKTAIRREECVQWRIDTLHEDPASWNIIDNSVSIKLQFGTKGPKHKNSKDQDIGPTRYITMPLSLAERVHHYFQYTRPKIRMIYVNSSSNDQERRRRLFEREDRMFLSEYDGRPINAKTLYKAWCSTGASPYAGWSPHLGRHFWACRTLLDNCRRRESLLARGVNITTDWISAGANSDLLLLIKPQLGHISEKTTEAYLVWLFRHALAPEKCEQWETFLETLASDIQ